MPDKRWPKRVVEEQYKRERDESPEARTTKMRRELDIFAEEYETLYQECKRLREAIDDALFNSDDYESRVILKRALEAK